MDQIQLPDPFAPLLQFVNSMNQSMQQAQLQQQKMHQQFMMCQEQLQESIEGILEKDEAVMAIGRRSERIQKEISGVMFVDEENDLVEEIHIDNIGSLTEVDLSMIKLPTDPGLSVFSFHTHPGFGNPNFSPADMDVVSARSWEEGHCILTEVNGDMTVNCMEI